MEQGKIPIIVGGTNYYIESIVYKILVEDTDDTESLLWDKSRRKRHIDEPDNINKVSDKKPNLEPNKDVDDEESSEETAEQVVKDHSKDANVKVVDKVQLQQDVDNEKNFSNEEIHQKLKDIDPVMAARLHPNNRRKVLR